MKSSCSASPRPVRQFHDRRERMSQNNGGSNSELRGRGASRRISRRARREPVRRAALLGAHCDAGGPPPIEQSPAISWVRRESRRACRAGCGASSPGAASLSPSRASSVFCTRPVLDSLLVADPFRAASSVGMSIWIFGYDLLFRREAPLNTVRERDDQRDHQNLEQHEVTAPNRI